MYVYADIHAAHTRTDKGQGERREPDKVQQPSGLVWVWWVGLDLGSGWV